MNSINATNVLNSTMFASGIMVGALAGAHATCLIGGLSAKVGAAVADRFGYQDAAEDLREIGDFYFNESAENLKTSLIAAGFFAAVGFGAYFAQNCFASGSMFDTQNVTHINSNSTNFTQFDSNFTNIDTFGFNSSNSSFFGNNTNSSF